MIDSVGIRSQYRRGLAVGAWLCIVLTASGCGSGPEPDPEPQPIPRQAILILLDAARVDRFSSYGYSRRTTPNLDALAAKGMLFNNHFTQGVNTRSALPPLLYSRYFLRPVFPTSSRVAFSDPEDLFRTRDAECLSLPAALSTAGMHTALISAHPWLTPTTDFAREFAEIHDLDRIVAAAQASGAGSGAEGAHRYNYPRAEVVVDYAIEWLRQNREKEFFLYLHLMDTHTPHFLDEDAKHFLGSEPIDGERLRLEGYGPPRTGRPLSPADRRYLDALYDGSLRYADRHLGRLVEDLRSRGALDNTLIAFTSDHGENLMEVPDRFGHDGEWNDAIARIPFFVHYPPQLAAGTTDAISENVDIMPTLLGLLDVPLPEGKRADGADLVGVIEGDLEPRRHALMRRGVRGERYKAVFPDEAEILLPTAVPDPQQLDAELYDLHLDPLEAVNLWREQPELARDSVTTYRSELGAAYRRYREAVTSEQPASAFAIASNYFRMEPRVESIDVGKTLALIRSGSLQGWQRAKHWSDFHLAAGAGAPPITIELRIPNGRYQLSVSQLGKAVFDLGDGLGESIVAAPSFRAEDWGDALDIHSIDWSDPTDVRTIEIRDERFRVRVAPHPEESVLLIRQFGFRPVVAGQKSDPAEDAARIERLKGLGYVR